MEVVWESEAWTSESGEPHSVDVQVNFCRSHLLQGGRMYGAFDRDKLVGIGLARWKVTPNMAQLAFLHVSNGYRRVGIGDHILRALVSAAMQRGADSMYVSATPSESAVGFYVRHGFNLADEPIPELFQKEPEDIHMLLDLRANT